jgi:hypothetical protein
MKKQVEVKLEEPIKIGSKDGQFEQADTVILYPPRPSQANQCIKIESEFKSAGIKFAKEFSKDEIKENEKKADEGGEADAYVEVMIAGKADFDVCFNNLKKILCYKGSKPVCEINGQTMKEGVFEEIGYKDLKKILGEFIVNFLS